MNAAKLSRRLLALISFFAVSLGLLSSFVWAQNRVPNEQPANARRDASGIGDVFRPGQAMVPLNQFPMHGGGQFIPPDIPVRSTEGVTGFDRRPTTRVQIGGPGGANVQEQIVNITQTPPADEITPFWTPDEQFIYFAAANREGGPFAGRYQFYRVSANASNDPGSVAPPAAARVTNEPGSDFLFPALSSNSARIVFIRSTDRRPVGDPAKRFDLYVANVPATGFIDLNPARGLVSLTAERTTGFVFSDVQRAAWLGASDIAFSGRLQGEANYHIFRVNITSGLILQLTGGPASELNPAVSPDGRFIAFDSNATGYIPVPGGSGATGVTGGERNIFAVTALGANATQVTDPANAIAGESNVHPTWSSSETNPRLNPGGGDVYIAFASTRRDVRANPADPASAITGFTVAPTFDIYYVRALNPLTNPPQAQPLGESAPAGPNPPRKLDTADPNYQFNDLYPTWPSFATILRLAHQSDRTGTLLKDRVGQGFTPTPGVHDLFISTVVDITAPTLIRYDTTRQDGEIVHINLGTGFNPSTAASVRTTREGVVPGGDLFFTVRVEDRESGMQPEKAAGGRGAVFLVFKNPNSKYQQNAGVERKEWTGVPLISPVTEGMPPARFTINFAATGAGTYFYGHEYEAQAISAADRTSYFFHTSTIGTLNPTDPTNPLSRAVVYTSSIQDANAFSGINSPPQDGGTYTLANGSTITTPNIYLPLQRLPEELQDNQGGILYGAPWRAPDQESDWYIDVVAYDNAVNPYNPSQRFNWIIYDNVWGFSTAPFADPPFPNVLVVSDYTLGQKFFTSRFGIRAGTNLLPVFYGAESYFTDVDMLTRNPVNAPPSGAGGMVRPYNQAAPFTVTVFAGGQVGGIWNFGLPNVLGVNSYTDQLNDDGTRVDGRPLPPTGRYQIWRVLSRGPVTPDVLTAYLPQPERQTPPDLRVGESTPRTARIYERMVVWASPFSGDLFVGPGAITDAQTQSNLANFVNAGGRLFISGQDLGFALVTANYGRGFFADILKAQLVNDSGGSQFLTATSIANQDNSIANEPFTRARHVYGRFDGTNWVYDPPSSGNIPVNINIGGPPAEARRDASQTSALLLGRLDVVTPIGNAYTQFNYSNGGSGIITSQFPSGGRVAYSSLGFESVGYEWYENNNAIYNLGRRAEIMHNITCSFRTGVITGQILNASQGGSPLPDVLVRAVSGIGAEAQAAIATAATDTNGNYRLVGLRPDNYTIYAYRRGFTIQHTAGVTVHGASQSRVNLSTTEAPPGALTGRIFRGGNRNTPAEQRTPLQGIEVQLRAQNLDGTYTVLRAVSGADGSYNVAAIPIGFYQVIANPRNVDEAGNPIPNTDTRFNANFNPNFTTVVVANPNQPEIEIGAGGNVTAQGQVEIRSGVTTTINFFLAAPPVTVQGRVIDQGTGAGIAGATVIARRTTGNTTVEVGRTTTDAQGNYSFPNVTEGPLVIEASAPGYSTNSITFAVANPGTGATAVTAPDIALTKLPPGSLSGVVTDAGTGQPVPGATVQLFFQGQGTPVLTQTVAAQRAPDGYVFNYRFDQVEAGSYTVRVVKDDLTADPVQIVVTVEPGAERRNVNFRLLPLQIYGAGIQLIALPYDYTGRESRSVFGLVPGSQEYNAFTIAEWTGQDYNIGPNIPFRLGRGYFVRLANVTTVQARGRAVPEASVAVPLVAGWNLIGHPFDPSVGDLTLATDVRVVPPGQDPNGPGISVAEAVAAGLVRDVVFSYTGSTGGSQYVQGNLIKPWFGYWFRAFQPVTLKLNRPAGRAALPADKTVTLKDVQTHRFRAIESKGTGDWRLQIAGRQGDLLDTDNTIGVTPDAKNGFDFRYDNEKPPIVNEAPSLYLALQGTNEAEGPRPSPTTSAPRTARARRGSSPSRREARAR